MELIKFIIILSLFLAGCSAAIGPDNIVIENPTQAVIDARKMIEEKINDPEKYTDWIQPAKLPKSLRIEKLQFAMVFDDHISLVLSRNPDWNIGVRIWSSDSLIEHNDKPTKYKNIYFYEYTNDLQESPDNIK
ncbi:MAG: hypothetical protein ABIG64_01280 [Candidatus Omnitrophota bacterium]